MSTDDRQLAIDIGEAYIASAMVKPMLPAGRREEILALLTAILADVNRAKRYAGYLNAERQEQCPEQQLCNPDAPELPVEQITQHGLAVLSDDLLADIAISPIAVVTLAELLCERHDKGECGSVWATAFAGDHRRDIVDWARRIKRADIHFLDELS